MFSDIAFLLINTFFYIAILLVYLRFLFQLIKADFYNPVSQFILKATGPVLIPLRRIIPPWKNLDVASLILIFILKIIELSAIALIKYGGAFSVYNIFIQSIFSLTSMALNFYLFAIFGQIILSWIAPHNDNPAIKLLYQITEPVMRPARKLLPPISGMDFSPIIVLFSIQILEILLLHPSGLLVSFFGLLGTGLDSL